MLERPRNMVIEPDCYYQINKVARFLDISVETLKREIERHEIEAHRFGREILAIRGAEIMKYLQDRKI